MKTSSGFESKILTAFIAAVFVVTGLAAVTWKLAHDAAVAAEWVAHTHEVLTAISRVRSGALQVELSTQNYRITGDPARIVERDAAIADRELALNTIQALSDDNPQQGVRLAQLRQVTAERIAISRRSEFLRKTEGVQAANAFVAGAPLKETRERAYRLLGEMLDEENHLLESRVAEQMRLRHILVVVGALVAALLCGLLTASYLVMRRQLREAESSRQALAQNEQSLSVTLHSIGDAVMATDTQGRITRMNPVAERLTGWGFAQAFGQPIENVFCIVNEDTREPAVVPVTEVLTTGLPQTLPKQTVLIARDGTEHPIADSAAPIRDDAGHVRGVVLVFQDVALERRAQHTIREQNQELAQRVEERTVQLHESQAHLNAVINNVPAMIAFVDSQRRYVYVNQHYSEQFAAGRTDIVGRTVQEILGEDRYAIAAPIIDKVLQGIPQNYDWQPFPDVWQGNHYVPKIDADGAVGGYYVLSNNITERKRAEAQIHALNENLARHVRDLEHVSRALRTLSAGNRAMLRATDEQDLLTSMCNAIVAAGDYDTAVVWYKEDDEFHTLWPMAESGYPDGLDALRQLNKSWAENARGRGAAAIASRTGQTNLIRDFLSDPNYALWNANFPDGSACVACPLRVGEEIIGALAIYSAQDETFDPEEIKLLAESADDLAFGISTLRARAEQRSIQESMHRLTRFDTLTDLPNETQFAETMAAAIEQGQRTQQPFALLQTNVERLSEINDALGFSHGDQLLREFAARIRSATAPSATVARLRGDEFAILMPDSDRTAAIAMATQLGELLAQPFPLADIALDVSAKIGVTLFPEHGATLHDLFRHMDAAVNQAKKTGVGQVVFDPLQSRNQSVRLTMAGELRRAIEGGDLLLYLQPKVEMATGKVCGAEGLVRWKHAQRGLIPPGEFIGLAENTGLIKPLTEWVIETALKLNHTWSARGLALPIAVNLSARNLRDEGLLQKIRQLQAKWGGATDLLEAEITESMVMDDAEFSLRVLRSLRDEGISLYIDDFGTGYSSLSYLLQMPVDYIKIDQSFIRHMASNKDSALIVRSTIELAHDLGRKVVAEGVETQADWNRLAALGCDLAQGYFIARPMPPDEFPQWLQEFRVPVTAPDWQT